MDFLLEFSDAQNIAASTLSSGASVISSYVRDLGASEKDCFGVALTPDIGESGELEFNVQVAAVFTGAGAIVNAKLTTKASSATLSSGGTTLATLAIPALSAAGYRKSVKVPSGSVLQYIGVVYTASGGGLTAGTVDAWIGLDHEKTD